jgi:hypothetical protein
VKTVLRKVRKAASKVLFCVAAVVFVVAAFTDGDAIDSL